MRPQAPELPLLSLNKPAAAPPSPPKPPMAWHALNAHAALPMAPVSAAAADAIGNRPFADPKPWRDTKDFNNVAPASNHLPVPGPMEFVRADKQLQLPPAGSPAAGLAADRSSEDVQMQVSAGRSPKPTAHAKARPDTPASSAFSKGVHVWSSSVCPQISRSMNNQDPCS